MQIFITSYTPDKQIVDFLKIAKNPYFEINCSFVTLRVLYTYIFYVRIICRKICRLSEDFLKRSMFQIPALFIYLLIYLFFLDFLDILFKLRNSFNFKGIIYQKKKINKPDLKKIKYLNIIFEMVYTNI